MYIFDTSSLYSFFIAVYLLSIDLYYIYLLNYICL